MLIRKLVSCVCCYAFIVVSLFPLQAGAQVHDGVKDFKARAFASGYLETLELNPDKAKLEGVGKEAIIFGGNMNYQFARYLNVGGGIGYMIIDDENKFSQRVENIFDDEEDKSSDILGLTTSLELGVSHMLRRVHFGVNGGFRYLHMEREISSCSNCRSEDVDIDSSSYYRPFLRYYASPYLGFEASMIDYSKDKELDRSVKVSVGYVF